MALSITLAACDDAGNASTPAPAAAPVSGISPVDGQPIRTLRPADLAGYAHEVRATIAARGLGAPDDALAPGTGVVSLSDALGDAVQGTDPVSTHIVIADGSIRQQYALNVDLSALTARRGGDDRYVAIDPEVFSPDPSDGMSTTREVPVTDLATGEEKTAEVTNEVATVEGEPIDMILVEAIPVHDEAMEENPGSGVFGAARPDATGQAVPDAQGNMVAVSLGIRSLRIDQNFDSGLTVNEKQEVQFTYQDGDDYTVEFPRANTARFDQSFWTTPDASPIPGATTIQPVYSSPAGTSNRRTLWYLAADVNYANIDYNFRNAGYYNCPFGSSACGAAITTATDFPLIVAVGSFTPFRVYVNEDDYAVTQFSTRSGDFRGLVATVDFSSGQVFPTDTRVDGNNHAGTGSDRVFERSGIRRVTGSALQIRTNNGANTVTLQNGGLRWELSRMTVPT